MKSPSKYQKDIFKFIQEGKGNGVIEAVAGSGKTTTILEALKLLPEKKSSIFLAFNKHIETELSRKVPEGTRVHTLHGLGFATIRRQMKNVVMDNDKVDNIITSLLPKKDRQWVPPAEFAAQRAVKMLMGNLISLCKGTLISASDYDAVQELIERHNLEVPLDWQFENLAKVLDASNAQLKIIDYDDMIYFPVFLDLNVEKFDYVFVDEAQDLNLCQQKLILKTVAPGGRIIAVGDRNQSIYGFRGADTSAIPNLIEGLSATVLPLSISYRCPKSHITLAQQIVPKIEAAPKALDGSVVNLLASDLHRTVLPGDMVLCRTNKPLVETAFALIRQGVKAKVMGRDIGRGLVLFVDRMKAKSVEELLSKLSDYARKEGDKLLQQDKLAQYDLLIDKIETLKIFTEMAVDLTEVKNRISNLFSDDVQGVTLSSVHKAKGLEADTVFILHPELLPFPKAKQPWEIEQESNIKYVALTRAKKNLYFVCEED